MKQAAKDTGTGEEVMSKFGNKFTCWSCSTKFYDLNKPNPVCPKCGASPSEDPNLGKLASAESGVAYSEDFEEDVDDDTSMDDDEESESDAEYDESTDVEDEY